MGTELWAGEFAKKWTKCPGTGEWQTVSHCFVIRGNKCLSSMDLVFVFSKGCTEHSRVMFNNRWSRTSNHWFKYKFLQWQQKAKDIKVTAVFFSFDHINWEPVPAGNSSAFSGIQLQQRSNFTVGACGPYLLHLTDLYLENIEIKNIFHVWNESSAHHHSCDCLAKENMKSGMIFSKIQIKETFKPSVS